MSMSGSASSALDRHRLDAVLARALRCGGLGHQVGAGLDRDQLRARGALEIGVADVAAADDAELDRGLHDRAQAPHAEQERAAGAGRAAPGPSACRARPPSSWRRPSRQALPEVAPVEHAGRRHRPSRPRPGSRPAGAMSLTWADGQPVCVALEPGRRIDAAAHQPGDVGLPGERAALPPPRRSARAGLGAVRGLQLPMVVVVAEREPLPAAAARPSAPSSAPSARQPSGRHVALLGRHRRHEELRRCRASGLRRPPQSGRLAQVGQADVAGRGRRGRARRAWPASSAASSRWRPTVSTWR